MAPDYFVKTDSLVLLNSNRKYLSDLSIDTDSGPLWRTQFKLILSFTQQEIAIRSINTAKLRKQINGNFLLLKYL